MRPEGGAVSQLRGARFPSCADAVGAARAGRQRPARAQPRGRVGSGVPPPPPEHGERPAPVCDRRRHPWPIRHGLVEDWDLMERFMEQVIFKYLRPEPEDHYFLIAAWTLAASWASRQVGEHTLTGIVIDSGDGVTHVIPVVGCSLRSQTVCVSVKVSLVFRWRYYIFHSADPKGEGGGNSPEQSLETAKAIKNVVLSGGSTMFRDFGHRLQRDLKRVVDARLKFSEELSGGWIKPKLVEVQVITHHMQRGLEVPCLLQQQSFSKYATPRRTMKNMALVFVVRILSLESCHNTCLMKVMGQISCW
ncbi:unnamed protein product [Natator depressus]